MCSHFPSYQSKTRAFTYLQDYLETQHLHRANTPSRKAILQAGLHRPKWTQYVLARTQVISLPMVSWNLKLVNIQKASRNHVWDLPSMVHEHTHPDNPDLQDATSDDLVRYPANSKSRFDQEEYDAAQQQRQHCNLYLHSVDVNRDLVSPPDHMRPAAPHWPVSPSQAAGCSYSPTA